MIQKAFPSYLQKDADKIADFLQQNDPKSFKTIGTEVVCLNGEVLELPQRVYFGEFNTQNLTLVQEQMLNCLYLCHSNGHLREFYLRELLAVKEDFALPFIAKLFGDYVIEIPETSECFSPIIASIPLQILAYYIAVYRGVNVDQPRNLAKSVTVE